VLDDEVRPALPAVLIGTRVGFLRTDLDAWLAAHREAPPLHWEPMQLDEPLTLESHPSIPGFSAEAIARAAEGARELKPLWPRKNRQRRDRK
jgi:hypothetical protein